MGRRRIIELVAAVMILGAAVVATSEPAQACSCARSSDQEHLQRADVVFEGVATSRSERSGDEHNGSYVWTFDVERLFKGQVTDPQDVSAGASGALCGISFELQTAYRVYASRSESKSLTTDSCSGTKKRSNVASTTSVVVRTTTTRAVTTTELPPTTVESTTSTAAIPTTASTATPTIAAERTGSTRPGGATVVAVALLAAVLGAALGAALMRRRLQRTLLDR